jgi:hypothetical protein
MVGMEDRQFDFGLGYNLGFRQPSYTITSKSVPAEAIINTIDTNGCTVPV